MGIWVNGEEQGGGGGLSAPVALSDLATQAEATIVGRASGAGTGVPVALTAAQAGLITNKVRQVAVKASSAQVQGTTIMPGDNTTPQITEGDAYITSDAFVPVAADSVLLIEVTTAIYIFSIDGISWGLFKNSDANAIDCNTIVSEGIYIKFLAVSSRQLAGSTASRTYQFRMGPNAANTLQNYHPTILRMNGVAQLTVMRITELAP